MIIVSDKNVVYTYEGCDNPKSHWFLFPLVGPSWYCPSICVL